MRTKQALIINTLRKEFPGISGIRPGEDLGYPEGSIFLGDCAEGGEIDDIAACNYYCASSIYEFGVHVKLAQRLHDFGYHAEAYDPGTYIAYES